MKILLHMCCAPCSIYPTERLKALDFTIMGFFYRHNIHPYSECMRREDTLRAYADDSEIKMIWQNDYDLENFLRKIVFREENRCRICYHERLYSTAKLAKTGKFDYFSSTLLYSKFQKHDLIAETGESVAKAVGIPFYYEDFRVGWKTGVEKSRELGLYRQQYCGCIYSEKQRHFPSNQRMSR